MVTALVRAGKIIMDREVLCTLLLHTRLFWGPGCQAELPTWNLAGGCFFMFGRMGPLSFPKNMTGKTRKLVGCNNHHLVLFRQPFSLHIMMTISY
jgi:hypothetical protein